MMWYHVLAFRLRADFSGGTVTTMRGYLNSMFMFTADVTSSAKSTSLGSCMSIAAAGNDSTTVYLTAISLRPTLVSNTTEPRQGAAHDEMLVVVYACL